MSYIFKDKNHWDKVDRRLCEIFDIEYLSSDMPDTYDLQQKSNHPELNPFQGLSHSDDTKKDLSEKAKANWNDPNSAYNSQEFRKKVGKNTIVNLKKLWQDKNSKFNSEEFRIKMSNKITEISVPKRKKYIATDPNGVEHFVHGLKPFCRIHGLNPGCMTNIADGKRKTYKGWTIKRVL